MPFLERLNAFVNRALAWMAGLALIAMMVFTVADMILRGFGYPIAGSYEVIGWLSAAAMALALGYAQLHRGHVAIDLVVTRLDARKRAAIDLFNSLLSLLLFAAVAFYVGRYAVTLHETGSLSETLKAPVYPWVYVVAFGCAGLAFALLIDLLRSTARFVTGRRAVAAPPAEL